MKRVIAGTVGVLMSLLPLGVGSGIETAEAVPVRTVQEEMQNNSGLVLCIGRVLDLFLIDIPEETQLVGIWVSDDFQCPSEGVG